MQNRISPPPPDPGATPRKTFGVPPGLRRFVASSRVRRAVRIVVSASILAVLFNGMDWSAALGHTARLTPGVLAFVIAAFAVQLALSSWKWQWALRIHDLRCRYGFLTRVLVIGFFLNNFLPTSIGGDAYRIYRTLPPAPPRSRAISAVLLERLVGLGALLLLGLAGAFVLYSATALARAYVTFAAIAALLAVAAFVIARAGLPEWISARYQRYGWLTPVRENLRSIALARGAWLPLIGLSLLFQAQAVVILFALFAAIDARIGLPQAALIAAAAGLATVIPFSINGLGIVEATIAGTAVAVGASYDAGLLVAVLMRILIIPLTLLAGLLYAFEPASTREITMSRPDTGNCRSPG